jgi:hypothetical protein
MFIDSSELRMKFFLRKRIDLLFYLGITFSDPLRLRRAGLKQTKPGASRLHFYFQPLCKASFARARK